MTTDAQAEGRTIRQRLRKVVERVPQDAWLIAILLVVSRATLTLIGQMTYYLLGMGPTTLFNKYALAFAVWAHWDAGFYERIAMAGYYKPYLFGWMPFYPLLIKAVNVVVDNYVLAGLIVSNVALVIACIYFYKLVRLHAERDVAFRSVKYLLVWPTAFVLSGMLTESTFLALCVAAFYYAEKRQWAVVGVLGYCAALTKIVGVVLIAPLLFEYLQQRQFKFRAIRANVLTLLFIPLGLASFLLLSYLGTGNAFQYFTVQSGIKIFHRTFDSVIGSVLSSFNYGPDELVWVSFAIVSFTLMMLFRHRLRFSWWLTTLLFLVVPLSAGSSGMPRYTITFFPLFFLLGTLTKNKTVDTLLTITLLLLQGFCVVFWSQMLMA